MYLNVDIVGLEAVVKVMQQTQLKRFIIYRQGAGKGNTPVFDSSHTTNNITAIKNFRDWAGTANQMSGLCYDILLFDNEADAQDESVKKRKVKYSFALSSFGQAPQAAPQGDIQSQVQQGIDIAMTKWQLEQANKRIQELEDGEEEEEEEEEESSTADKIISYMMQQNQGGNNATAMAGDNSLDEESIVEEKIKQQFTPAQMAVKQANQKKALTILWDKDKDLDRDLMRLAHMCKHNFVQFKLMVANLRQNIPNPQI